MVEFIIFILWTNILSAYIIRFWINLPKYLKYFSGVRDILNFIIDTVEKLIENGGF